jgi:hypothetical protein
MCVNASASINGVINQWSVISNVSNQCQMLAIGTSCVHAAVRCTVAGLQPHCLVARFPLPAYLDGHRYTAPHRCLLFMNWWNRANTLFAPLERTLGGT